MRGYKIVARILLTLSVINFALTAPVVVRELEVRVIKSNDGPRPNSAPPIGKLFLSHVHLGQLALHFATLPLQFTNPPLQFVNPPLQFVSPPLQSPLQFVGPPLQFVSPPLQFSNPPF